MLLVRRRRSSSLIVAGLAVALAPLFVARTAAAQDTEGDQPDRCGGPYLFVAGGDPDTERLPLKETSADIRVAG
jgi:hypothetical protein